MAFLPACINLSVAIRVARCDLNRPHSILCANETVNQIQPVQSPGGCECVRRGLRQGPLPARYEAVCCFASSLKKRRKFAAVAAATSSAPKFLTDAIAFATSAT